ncbi:hypothetical protein M432DRAFT_386117 [Thermoascus aurantiacus ATCC 26904]
MLSTRLLSYPFTRATGKCLYLSLWRAWLLWSFVRLDDVARRTYLSEMMRVGLEGGSPMSLERCRFLILCVIESKTASLLEFQGLLILFNYVSLPSTDYRI